MVADKLKGGEALQLILIWGWMGVCVWGGWGWGWVCVWGGGVCVTLCISCTCIYHFLLFRRKHLSNWNISVSTVIDQSL